MLIFSKLCWPCLISIFLLIPELHNAFRGRRLGFKFVCSPASLSAFIHKRPPPRFPLAAYTNKHTPVCRWKQILMKSNWEENIWYLSFMFGLSWAFFYWKRPAENESWSPIWDIDERKRRKQSLFFVSYVLLSPCFCHFAVCRSTWDEVNGGVFKKPWV